MTQQTKIGFIGAGNMAGSIITGLIKQGYPAHSITACDPKTDTLSKLKKDLDINTIKDNKTLLEQVDVVVLAVKPQVMRQVLEPLKQLNTNQQPLFISIAAGVLSKQINLWLNKPRAAVIRVMPNTPALVGYGASGLFANEHASVADKKLAESIMQAVGTYIWLDDEALIDSVTALSGSGPAYFFYLMEAMYKAGTANHLSSADAKKLTLQTALGAAKLAAKSDLDFETLRKQVTSAGGTTEKAINTMAEHEFLTIINKAINAAVERSVELSKDL